MIFLIILVIRIAILYTFIKYFIYADGWINRIIIFLVFFFYCFANILSIAPHKINPNIHGKEKACFSNIRVLTGAVEMYNMDISPMMEKLDMQKLVETKYIKSIIIGPEKECEYLTEGNLAENGFIYCVNHGDIERKKTKEIEARKKEEKERKEEEEKKSFTYPFRKVLSMLWNLEVKIDTFFASLFNTNKTPVEFILIFILLPLGFSSQFLSCGGIINIILCISILRMFKKEENPKEEYVVVYEDNSEPDDNEQSNQSTNTTEETVDIPK